MFLDEQETPETPATPDVAETTQAPEGGFAEHTLDENNVA